MANKGSGERIKLVVVGDGAVGKTCLLISYVQNEFPEKYVPTVFENYVKTVNRPDGELCFDLWDTAGQEDFDRLRPLSYPDTDIVLICFSLVAKRSYDNVKERWSPEIRHYLPEVAIVLVGTKSDLRDANEPDQFTGRVEPITAEMGQQLATTIGAIRFMETSARTRKGLTEIFDAAIETVLSSRKGGKHGTTEGKKKKGCIVL